MIWQTTQQNWYRSEDRQPTLGTRVFCRLPDGSFKVLALALDKTWFQDGNCDDYWDLEGILWTPFPTNLSYIETDN